MAIPRKERRALEYVREQQGLPKAKPWEHTRELRARQRAAEMLRALITLCNEHGFDLDQLRQMLDTSL